MAFWCRIGGLQRLRSLLTPQSTGWLHVAHRTAPERRRTADLERNLNVLHFHGSSIVHFTPFVFIPPQKSSQLSPNRDRSFPSHDAISRRGLSSARDKSRREKGAGALLTNEEIVAEHVRLVTDEGHGIVTRWEALERARKLGLDLVEVSHDSDPPVCKIMDFHKEKFRKQAIVKERAKKAKADTSLRVEHKEVKFQGKIEKRDLEMKANMVKKLMERGYRVKITAEAKKRRSSSNAEKEDLSEVLSRLYNLVEDVSIVESPPSVQDRMAYMVVRHAKFGTKKKNAKKIMASDEVDDDSRESSIQQPSVGAPEQTMVPKFFESRSEPDGRRIAPSLSNARRPTMENSRSDPSWNGIKVAPGMGKAKSDFESDPRGPHIAPAPNPTVAVPPAPEIGNRYMKVGPGRNAAARNPYQPSPVNARREGLRDLKPRNSDPEHLNHPGRGPLRPTYERQQDYADSGTKPVSGMSSNSAARTPSQPSWVNTRKVGRLDTEARNSDPENFNPRGRAPLRPFTRQQKYDDSDRNPEGSPPGPSSPRRNFGVFSSSSSDTTAPKPGSK